MTVLTRIYSCSGVSFTANKASNGAGFIALDSAQVSFLDTVSFTWNTATSQGEVAFSRLFSRGCTYTAFFCFATW